MSTLHTAVITGGARGIGLVLAETLVTSGIKIVICSRTQSDLDTALKKLNSQKQLAFGIKIDVSKPSHCRRLITYAHKAFGPIDILINNAGIYGPVGPVDENPANFWRQTLEINLLGMVYCCQLVIPFMKHRNAGKIINLCGGGVGGQSSLPRFSAYYTSKVSVAGFTEVLAEEVKDFNIQVNCIAPGAVNTSLTDYLLSLGPEKSGNALYQRALDQKKTGGDSPQLAAQLVRFLISPRSDHLSGRLISAKWDSLKKLSQPLISPNLLKLRRIDNHTFWERDV